MNTQRMPALFVGHGDPMIALRHDELTDKWGEIGTQIVNKFGKPRAILCVSAHWFTEGTFTQSAEQPQHINDMYGFPQALYEVRYPVSGSLELTDAVCAALGDRVSINDDWGIDHGAWTVLVHMFPEADIPVVQLSVDAMIDAQEAYDIGRALNSLRDQGFLLLGSGNVVHNLRQVRWDLADGTTQAQEFSDAIRSAITQRNDQAVIDYEQLPHAQYAVPTQDHFFPLLYVLGAADGSETPLVFNDVCNLGSISMTGYAFGM